MTIHPARLARIRDHQEHAHTLVGHGATLTHQESLQLLEDLDDMLNDHTNTHRGQR